tara:strand:- start:353 stop:676 length:324 start_codon:yes stop_codon:yes gene_type:complete
MNPFIRSYEELMLITKPKENGDERIENNRYEKEIKDGTKENTILDDCTNNTKITLPSLPKNTRKKWIRSKKAISKFLKELDYNNQIQSTYELTLIDSQQQYDKQDIA